MKHYWIITKKGLLIAVAMLLLAAFVIIILASGNTQSASVAAVERKIPIYSTQREDKKIALSFDAAWGNEDTQQLIDILAAKGVKATFFLVGEWVDKYPESVKALHDAGHEIGNHSNTHPYMTTLSKDQMCAEINACNDKIEAVTGTRPTVFRPPYGDYDNAVIEAVDSLQMHTIQWDVDSLDWKDLPAGDIISRVCGKVTSGSIILFHNAAKNTPEALPAILDKLLSEGYMPVTMSELIYQDHYTIDHSGRQISDGTVSSEESSEIIP